jgi:hypothetical protein
MLIILCEMLCDRIILKRRECSIQKKLGWTPKETKGKLSWFYWRLYKNSYWRQMLKYIGENTWVKLNTSFRQSSKYLPEADEHVCKSFCTCEKCKYYPVHHPFYLETRQVQINLLKYYIYRKIQRDSWTYYGVPLVFHYGVMLQQIIKQKIKKSHDTECVQCQKKFLGLWTSACL